MCATVVITCICFVDARKLKEFERQKRKHEVGMVHLPRKGTLLYKHCLGSSMACRLYTILPTYLVRVTLRGVAEDCRLIGTKKGREFEIHTKSIRACADSCHNSACNPLTTYFSSV